MSDDDGILSQETLEYYRKDMIDPDEDEEPLWPWLLVLVALAIGVIFFMF